MDANKAIVIMMVVLVTGMFSGLAYDSHNKSTVLVACYEAAKTNLTLKCEATK
jgi:hypothetical protein